MVRRAASAPEQQLRAPVRTRRVEGTGPVPAIDALLAKKPDAKIALLQGSFDWIHNGHLDLIAAVSRTAVDLVVVMPTTTNENKAFLQDGAAARLALIESAVGDRDDLDGKVAVSGAALAQQDHSHGLMEQLLESYPRARFSYVLGADAFNQSAHWPTFGVVEDHMDLLVVPRAGVKLERPARADALIDVKTTAISSTEIRRALAEGDVTGLRGRVPAATLRALEAELSRLHASERAGKRAVGN